MGAAVVVSSDYPSDAITDTLQRNFDANSVSGRTGSCHCMGHAWGSDVAPLLAPLGQDKRFDVLLLADTLWLKAPHDPTMSTP